MLKKLNSKDINYLEDKGIDINNFCIDKPLIAQEKILKLIKETYRVIETFPKCEEWILKNQLRGSVQSVLANLIEGNNQLYQKKQIQFFSISLGSLLETESHYLIAVTLGYITEKEYKAMENLINEIKKLMITYINNILKNS